MKKLSQLVAAFLLIVGLLGSSVALQAFAATHTLQFVETPAIALYSSESASATSLVVTPVPVDLDGNVLTMASFGSSPTLTVDPGILGAEEIESFTSITNNGNNTATLGGLTRDLQSQYPYGTNGVGQSHGAGATVVFSNNPQLYNRLASWENDGIVTGSWVYVTQPTYLTTQTFTNPLALADIAYVNGVAIQGAGTSTEGTMGVVRLATFGQVGTGLASSTSGQPLVIENKFASSTYNGSTVFQGEIPALRSTKNIDPNFIATSSTDNYNFGGTLVFNGTTTVGASTGGLLVNASTTITATTTVLGNFISQTNIQTFTSASTTVVWPMPLVLATTTGTTFPASAFNASTTNNFIGFAVQGEVQGSPLLVQTSGIVSGFTGLTAGRQYFLANATGTISTTAGTNAVYVGQAINSTQLLVAAGRNLSTTLVTGSASAANTGNNAQTTVTAICPTGQIVVGGGGLFNAAQPIWLQASFPSASNVWTAIFGAGSTGGGSGGNVNAYAICINP